jgi:hypothetical protein
MKNNWTALWQSNEISSADVAQLTTDAQLYPYCSALQIANEAALAQHDAANRAAHLHRATAYAGNIFMLHQQMANFSLSKIKHASDELLMPLFTDNYFAHQKIEVDAAAVEAFVEEQKVEKEKGITLAQTKEAEENNADQSLMITMSFEEWLLYFKSKKEKETKEKDSQEAMRAMWQKEKLKAANEEENDLIPENVFKMAIDSISLGENTASESLAEIMLKQGKTDKAIEMYRKLSLLNPEKSSYFALKIKQINKNNQ